MNEEKSQVETQTPKYKVGDLVWLPMFRSVDGGKGVVFVQTTITAVVYSRFGGKSTFEGYMTANEREYKSIREEGTLATREETEALIDRIESKVKAETEKGK